MSAIQAMPNQSILDIIIQGCGSMEAAMQFCRDNGISISDYPEISAEYTISKKASAKGDTSVLAYLRQKGIVVGTLGYVPVLGFRIVLKPMVHFVATNTDPVSASGYYYYNLEVTPAFYHLNPIAAGDYPSTGNRVCYETEDRIISGLAADIASESGGVLVMNDKVIPYKIPWVAGRGFMMVWSEPGAAVKTTTFEDAAGNRAYVSPVVVLDPDEQRAVEFLIPRLDIAVVSTGHNAVKLRLTRSHDGVTYVDFAHPVMTWLHDAAGGTPDPLEPGNADKTIVTLSRGVHLLGVGAVYVNGPYVYPASAFSMVVEVF